MEMIGNVWREANLLRWQKGRMPTSEKGPSKMQLLRELTDGLCNRGLFTILPWPQSWEWDRGRWNLLLRNLLTSVFFAPTGCTKEPEKTVRGPKGVWPWLDQAMWSVSVVLDTGTEMGMNSTTRPPPVPTGLRCTALSSYLSLEHGSCSSLGFSMLRKTGIW